MWIARVWLPAETQGVYFSEGQAAPTSLRHVRQAHLRKVARLPVGSRIPVAGDRTPPRPSVGCVKGNATQSGEAFGHSRILPHSPQHVNRFDSSTLRVLNPARSTSRVSPFAGEGGTVRREWGRSGNDVCTVEPDDHSLPSIKQFFTEQRFRVVHPEPPPEPSADAWRQTSSRKRRARRSYRAYWADLEGLNSSTRVPWYGGGDSEEDASVVLVNGGGVEQEGAQPLRGERLRP